MNRNLSSAESQIDLFRKLLASFTTEILLRIELLAGAGSNRKYFRLYVSQGTYIGVVGESELENRTFLILSRWFATKSLNVPEVLAESDDLMAYVISDLGSQSLFDLIRSTSVSDDEKRAMLLKVVRYLPRIQYEGAAGFNFDLCYPQSELTVEQIRWDLNYFKYYFLKPSVATFDEPRLERAFDRLVERLPLTPANTFMYRDFQSRNVMLCNGEPFFIDYQGGRRGPIQYDLVSLLWQAKAGFSAELRAELMEAYIEEVMRYQEINALEFRSSIPLFALFRLLQVLGAYGYRGYFERKPHFLESVPLALRQLVALRQEAPTLCEGELSYLFELFDQIVSAASSSTASLLAPLDPKLTLRIQSFSYRETLPEDPSGNGGGFVFDCRSLPNPGRNPRFHDQTGCDPEVIAELEQLIEVERFLEHAERLVGQSIDTYLARGFSHLMVSFGCTGGQHRSVYSTEQIAARMARLYPQIEIIRTHTSEAAHRLIRL